MRNTGLDEAQTGIKIAGRNINNLRYADSTTHMAESKEEWASWWKWKSRVKSWLKAQHSENEDHSIQCHHFMENRWETVKQWETLFWGAPKSLQMVTAARKYKKRLLLGRKAMTNLDSILKTRDITWQTKVHLVKPLISPVMYGCESWTIKQSEHRRIDGFDLWCWRRLLRVPWNARRPNHSILKEISLEYSLEGLMLKLKL